MTDSQTSRNEVDIQRLLVAGVKKLILFTLVPFRKYQLYQTNE